MKDDIDGKKFVFMKTRKGWNFFSENIYVLLILMYLGDCWVLRQQEILDLDIPTSMLQTGNVALYIENYKFALRETCVQCERKLLLLK